MRATSPRTAPNTLMNLTAADLMTTPVRTLPEETTLRDAAFLLTHERISGAPVVDGSGRCVGVLSASDFVTWAGTDGNGKVIHFIAPWGEMIDLDGCPAHEIRRYMTTRPVTAAPTASISQLAQQMVDAHIHRVLVVDEQNRPRGIVASTDILAAVARAAPKAPPKALDRCHDAVPTP